MLTILSESTQGGILKNFREHRWMSSNNLPDTATKTFWIIRTPQRKFTFIEYMKLKFFFDFPSEVEWRCMVDAPGFLSDNLFISAIIAKRQVEDKELLLHRLNILQKLIGRKIWNENQFFTLNGVMKFSIEEIRKSIRPADKYSGYVRNSSSVGSKSSNKIFVPEPETPEWIDTKEIDFLEFLTVGEFTSGIAPGSIFFTLMKDQKSETVLFSNKFI